MGLSIRARAAQRALAAARRAEREALDAEANRVRRTMLTRKDAATYLGVRPGFLRDAWAQGIGPRAIKLGTKRQSRVLYAIEELDRWRSDPQSYDTPARDCGPFEPPRRGSPR